MALKLISLAPKLQVIVFIDLDDFETDSLSHTCKQLHDLVALCRKGIGRKIGARPSVSPR